MSLWVPRPGTQRTWEKKHAKGKKWILLIELQLPGAEGRRSLRRPSGQQHGCRQGSSRLHLELAGAGAAEQGQRRGRWVLSGAWERAEVLESRLEVG